MVKNAFKLTDKAIAKREQFKEDGLINSGVDLIFGGLQETVNIIGKSTAGFAATVFTAPNAGTQWLQTAFGDATDGKSKEVYSVYDAWFDTSMNFLNTKVLPVSKDKRHTLLDQDGNIQWKFRNFAKMGTDMLPFTLNLINEAKKGKLNSITKSYGNFILRNTAKNVKSPITRKLREKMIMVDAAFRMTVADNVKYAQDEGLTGVQALAYGSAVSLGTGLSQLVMPDTNFLKGAVGKNLLKNFRGNLKSVANKKAASAATKQFFVNMAKELGEEEIEFAVEQASKYATGLAVADKSEFLAHQKQIIAGVGMLSTGLGGLGSLSTYKQTKQAVYDGILKEPQMTLSYLETMHKSTTDKNQKKEINKTIQFAKSVIDAGKIAPENVTADQIDLLAQKQKLLEQKKA